MARAVLEDVKMSDLKRYVNTRKKRDKKFAQGYDEGYERFKVGAIRLEKSGKSL
jgi:hypothetical protein